MVLCLEWYQQAGLWQKKMLGPRTMEKWKFGRAGRGREPACAKAQRLCHGLSREMLVTEVFELTLRTVCKDLNLIAERDLRDCHCTPHFRLKSGKVMWLIQHHKTDLSKDSDM